MLFFFPCFGDAFALEPGDLQRITISNQTSYDLVSLYFLHEDSQIWGPDVLGSRWVDPGSEYGFYLHVHRGAKKISLLAVDDDGDCYMLENVSVDVNGEAYVQIGPQHISRNLREPETSRVILTNATGSDILLMFFSPSDSQMWGVDILDDRTLFRRGDSLALHVPSQYPGAYDILALDREYDSYYRHLEFPGDESQWYVDITDAQKAE